MLTSEAPGGFARAAVVGAGLMGRRIAGVLASAGLDVAITDTNTEILCAAATEASEVTGAGRGSVTAVADMAAAVGDADLVIEAIIEDLAIKQEPVRTVGRHGARCGAGDQHFGAAGWCGHRAGATTAAA